LTHSNYAAWTARVLFELCKIWTQFSWPTQQNNRKRLVWAFVAHFCHLPFYAIKRWSYCPKRIPYIDLFSLYWRVKIFLFFFQLYFVMSSFQNALWTFKLIKTTNQSVIVWETFPGRSTCLRLWHIACMRVHMCVFRPYCPYLMLFYCNYTERSNFRSNNEKHIQYFWYDSELKTTLVFHNVLYP
jgi:hypothetical protein